jgi:vacuolar-type H+-ATPase subunit I/STV1
MKAPQASESAFKIAGAILLGILFGGITNAISAVVGVARDYGCFGIPIGLTHDLQLNIAISILIPLIAIFLSFAITRARSGKKANYRYAILFSLTLLVIWILLYSVGIDQVSSLCPTGAIAYPGYIAQGPLLHSGTFTFASVGQATSTNWAGSNIVFVEGGAPLSVVPTVPGCAYNSGALNSGQSIAAFNVTSYSTGASTSLCTALPTTVGTPINGALWVEYTTSNGGAQYFAQIAVIELKAS